MQFKALWLVLVLGSAQALAGETFTETYCFKMPERLMGGVTKIRATFSVDRKDGEAWTREVTAVELLESRILKGAKASYYSSNPHGDRSRLIYGRLSLEDGVIVSGRYMVTDATFFASLRNLTNDQYTKSDNETTELWSGVNPLRPRLVFADNGERLADITGKSCR